MELIISVAAVFVAVVIAFFIFSTFFSKRIENNVLGNIRDSFSAVSREALSQNNEDFLRQASEKLTHERELTAKELANKKEQIDNTLNLLKAEMEKVQRLMTDIDKSTEGKFSRVDSGIKSQSEATERLSEIIGNLNKVLSPSQSRGQWGERMAEDILNLVGMEEGVSYAKQKSLDSSRNRPDFSFYLPQGKIVNMDVKFPFDNYRKYCEEQENELIRENLKKEFLKNARAQIKSVTTRDYINTDANTLDYVLVFIPLEQAYSFILEHDRTFIDDALRQKVIVCSPWSLYAYLSVIRQSIENFNMERSAGKILELMGNFTKQWEIYKDSLNKIGAKIENLQSDFDNLKTTRTNQLEKPLRQIDELTKQRELTANGSDQSQD